MSAYSEFETPWGMSFPSVGALAGFHMVFTGSCWLSSGDTRLQLNAGDIALLPHGAGHAISDHPSTPLVPYTGGRIPRYTARSPRHALLCGVYKFGAVGPDPLLALLPEVVHVPARHVEATPAFSAVLHALRDEVRSQDAGHDAVVSSLVDAAFVFIVRCWLARNGPVGGSWLGALRDPSVSRCLAAIHGAPEERWSVEKLAELAGMSRAAFARRFTQLVGVSPLAYVAARRLDLAARLLREGDQPLGQIAARVGYESEFALSRAFKRSHEVAPGRYRALHREPVHRGA
jgi:AraC-like DNA-binding protein